MYIYIWWRYFSSHWTPTVIYNIYRRFRGASPACPTPLDREIDLDFDSFARCEAKLRERVRRASLSLGLSVGSCAVRWVPCLRVL